MRAFVTGATGFVGGRLVRALRGRGEEVVALVPVPARARELRELGCGLVAGDPASVGCRQLRGCDAVFHVAAGEPAGGTEQLLAAALEAGVPCVVHVSSVSAFGDTKGHVVDETYRRPAGRFVSERDEAAWRAHERARAHVGVRIAVPGLVYGVGDRSHVGRQLEAAMTGRLRFVSFPAVGVNAVHVDDAVAGLLLVRDRGADGEEYVLGGELATMRKLVARAAAAAGRRAPRLTMPTTLLRLGAPLAGRVAGVPPDAEELLAASDRATHWASDAKARGELGYSPRGLDRGLAETAAAAA